MRDFSLFNGDSVAHNQSADTLNSFSDVQDVSISFYAYLQLAPMYAMDIITQIHQLGQSSKLKSAFAHFQTWGFNDPEPVLYQFYDQYEKIDNNWEELIKSRTKLWMAFLLNERDKPAMVWSLVQLARIIGFTLKANVKYSRKLVSKCQNLIACLIINYEHVMNDPKFLNRLRETQHMLDTISNFTIPMLDCVQENSIAQTISNLAQSFSSIELSNSQVDNVKTLFLKLEKIRLSTFENEKNEILKGCSHLSNVNDVGDWERSSRWFREQGSIQERKALIQFGYKKYYASNQSTTDSVLIANYIKYMVREIPFGLVPDCVQQILVQLLQSDKLEPEKVLLVKHVLSISPSRFTVLAEIAKVCKMILEKGVIMPMKPTSLASIVTVTSDQRLEQHEMSSIQSRLDSWHKCWATIILNQQIIFE